MKLSLSVSQAIASGPLPVEVIDQHMKVVRYHVAPGMAESIDVDPGLVIIRAFMPDGSLVSEQRDLRDAPANSAVVLGDQYTLEASSPGIEGFGTTPGTQLDPLLENSDVAPVGLVCPIDGLEGDAELNLAFVSRFAPLPAPGTTNLTAVSNLALSSASRANSRSLAVDLPWLAVDPTAQLLPPMLRIGGTGLVCRVLSIPGDAVSLGIAPGDTGRARGNGDTGGRARVVVNTTNREAESMASLLTSGDFVGANGLAKALLERKMEDPYAAAIGGYGLLRTGHAVQVDSWTRNLLTRFPFLPDAAVIHGWVELHRQSSDFSAARRLFLEATRLGVPVYTIGLRMLLDGLKLMDQMTPDLATKEALEKIQQVAACAIWRSPLTCYYAFRPESPTREAAWAGGVGASLYIPATRKD
jgi:hypothetical protein